MGKTVAGFTMSLDGFIADANDDISQIFRWYYNGDTEIPLGDSGMVSRLSAASAAIFQARLDNIGVIVTGRRDLEVSRAWGGKPPVGERVFILTHNPPPAWTHPGSPFTFVSDGIASAVAQAQAIAGDKIVAIGSSTTTQQAIQAGLLDEIEIDLVPVLLGSGVRLFDHLGSTAIALEFLSVVEGTGVIHLRYRVIK